jgi:uncharacterized protein YecT (DUF1311 family)
MRFLYPFPDGFAMVVPATAGGFRGCKRLAILYVSTRMAWILFRLNLCARSYFELRILAVNFMQFANFVVYLRAFSS